MNKKKILIVGAGGIGSFLIPLLDRVKLYEITAADPDKVEKKNLTYQNFKEKELEMNKAGVMDWNYDSVKYHTPYPILTENQIQGYDLVVCCADNLDVRRLLYRSKVKLYDTLVACPEGSFSWQGDSWDGSNQSVHFMQVVAAGMGAQWIQRFFAGDDVGDFKVVNV